MLDQSAGQVRGMGPPVRLAVSLGTGVRHLIMDMGIGETLEGGRLGSKIIIAVSVVVIVLAGVWIW